MNKAIIIRFTGNKQQLYKQLKVWCAKADKTMNGTVVELIEQHLCKKK